MATPTAPQTRNLPKFTPGFNPETIALKFADGKPMPANEYHHEDQVMFTLLAQPGEPERKWFATIKDAKTIEQMRIAPGEPFQVCKTELRTGNRRIVQVEIRAVVPPEPAPPAPPAPQQPVPKQPAETPTRAAAGAHQGPGNNSHLNGSTAHNSTPARMNGNGDTSAVLFARCYRDAVDIAIVTVEYAKKCGITLAPSFEDVRCLAATIAIAECTRR